MNSKIKAWSFIIIGVGSLILAINRATSYSRVTPIYDDGDLTVGIASLTVFPYGLFAILLSISFLSFFMAFLLFRKFYKQGRQL